MVITKWMLSSFITHDNFFFFKLVTFKFLKMCFIPAEIKLCPNEKNNTFHNPDTGTDLLLFWCKIRNTHGDMIWSFWIFWKGLKQVNNPHLKLTKVKVLKHVFCSLFLNLFILLFMYSSQLGNTSGKASFQSQLGSPEKAIRVPLSMCISKEVKLQHCGS